MAGGFDMRKFNGGGFNAKYGGHKYGAKRIDHAGFSFASKGEAALYDVLKVLEKGGELTDIKCQDVVYLTDARIMYKPDFRVLDRKNNRLEWHEFKGFETSDWRIKRRLWKYYGPGPLHIWGGSHKNPTLRETVIP